VQRKKLLNCHGWRDIFIPMQRPRVLIVDDDTAYAKELAGALESVFRVEVCHSEAEFRERFVPGRYDLLIVDMRLEKDREGLAILREALAADPMQAAIVMTAYADMETYSEALEAGAMTYLDKAEFSPALIASTVDAIIEQSRLRRRMNEIEERIRATEPLEIIGASPSVRRVRDEIRRAAESDAPVLLIGGPGSGKELVARNIHRLNRRRSKGPFVHAVCKRGLRDDLTTCLFGAVQPLEKRSASASKGWIEGAHSGVLFLDGTDGLDEAAWAAVCSLMESGRCMHPASGRKIESDAQIVVAERPECARIERVAVNSAVRIAIPDLREHIEDVAILAQYVLQGLFRDGRTNARSLRGAALAVLERLPWPGNVRELQCVIAYAAVRADAEGQREIGPEHLPMNAGEVGGSVSLPPRGYDYQQNLARAELALVEAAIETFGSTTKTDLARRLGYNDRFVFARRIRKCIAAYPASTFEFPRTIEMMAGKEIRVAANSADGRK